MERVATTCRRERDACCQSHGPKVCAEASFQIAVKVVRNHRHALSVVVRFCAINGVAMGLRRRSALLFCFVAVDCTACAVRNSITLLRFRVGPSLMPPVRV